MFKTILKVVYVTIAAVLCFILYLGFYNTFRSDYVVELTSSAVKEKNYEKIAKVFNVTFDLNSILSTQPTDKAHLEVLPSISRVDAITYKKNEENAAESPDEELPAEDMAVPAQMPDAEEPPISLEEPIEEPAPEADKEAQEEPWTPEEPVKDMEEPPISPLPEAEDEVAEEPSEELAGEEKPEEDIHPIPPAPVSADPAHPAPAAETGPVYQFPPLSLLHAGTGAGQGEADAGQKAALIESTLASFGVRAKVVHYSVGPTVTRFELKPEMGVRVSKIEGLSNELAMALEATHIRIEAPIPGKSAVGIEIPNTKAASVPLHDVLASDAFQHGKGHILVALGKDITGKTVVTDLAKAPHLLIAGSTGSGKSVCINSIITSIIYHSRPDEVKLMLIDPKVVELSVYNGIPHLRTEVVTDMKKAQGTLNWAVREMEARYQLFAGAKVRNIEGYNKLYPDKKMPYILLIVDEFADLMNVAAKEVEVLIQRLTQKARAAGIHLILATQRPSADVITGVIKSNIPSRIAFMVESGLNSRIILDEGGAESLLGKGDMLFKQAGALSTVRVQGAFISDEEVEDVVNYVRAECIRQESHVIYEPIDLSIPEKTEKEDEMVEEQDDLMPEASEWVLDTKRASVSALQRRFRIGYTRAGRLMDTMERLGIVGPAEGAKPRDILVDKEQLSDILAGGKKEEPSD